MKNLLEYSNVVRNPYHGAYKEVLQKIGIPNIRKSYIDQLEHLIKETVPSKVLPGDMMNDQNKLVATSERRAREINEILQIILLTINYDEIKSSELKQLMELFKFHMFGRQHQNLNSQGKYKILRSFLINLTQINNFRIGPP
jgi:nuclear pore complex protein Nup188